MEIFDYAYCPSFQKKLESLAILSPEKWEFEGGEVNGILKNYVFHTFGKVYSEDKVVENKNKSLFNTGLLDGGYKPIFGLFVLNDAGGKQKWKLDSFCNEYETTKMGFTDLPDRASYFEDISDLVFDTKLKIVPQYDHIFGDFENLQRLPKNVRDSSMRQVLFDGAIDLARSKLRANYNTAIPQYYRGKMQLLIPICLQNPDIPDVALTCEKTEDGKAYTASTCLTLQMAYNNARLIAKPESNWLIP